MPIKGLTDSNQFGTGLPRIATLYKGDEKPADGKRPGKDLDYFRVEFEPQFEHLRPAWEGLYGEKPAQFEPVFLAAPTADEAFSSWKEEWNASATLLHRCDGEYQVNWYDTSTQMYMRSRMPCAAPQCGCKQVGRLNLFIPEFIEAAGVLGHIVVTTHSLNDILTVYRYLSDIERLYGRVNGVPFVFGRASKEVSSPKTAKNGAREGRIKVKKSLFYLHVTGDFTSTVLLPTLSGATALPAPQTPGIDAEAAKRQLGQGNLPRRIGAAQLPAPETEPLHWTDDTDEWDEFVAWAQRRFDLDENGVLTALEAATDTLINKPSDWRESKKRAGAAVIAMSCEYDESTIDRVTASGGFAVETRDEAVVIAQRVREVMPS